MDVSIRGETTPLACPSCGAPIPAEDVNVALMVALCRGCASTVELAAGRSRPPAALLELAAPPAGLTIEDRGGALVLRRRWFEPNGAFFFMVLWCVLWDGFLVVWYLAAFAGLASGDVSSIGMALFPTLHVIAGVGVTYFTLATAINHSTITLDDTHLRIAHGPLPWRAPDPVPLRSIDQLYLTQRLQKNQRTFTLVARRLDRTSVELLSGLPRDEQARFLEQRIESHLGIPDRAVEGEYTG